MGNANTEHQKRKRKRRRERSKSQGARLYIDWLDACLKRKLERMPYSKACE